MSEKEYSVRNAKPVEFAEIGKLMVQVYSQLDGFPKESEQPDYYKMLANIGELTNQPETELLVAVSAEDKIAGGVVCFGDLKYYGSGGTATKEQNASGFRLLAVDPSIRGKGIGKLLMDRLIEEAKEKKFNRIIWQVLDWNEPAINFYKKYSAEFDGEWLNCQLYV